MDKLPSHLQKYIDLNNAKPKNEQIKFGYKIEEIDCDEIFKLHEEK